LQYRFTSVAEKIVFFYFDFSESKHNVHVIYCLKKRASLNSDRSVLVF